MTQFKGFETKEQAEQFKKEHGGMITTRVLTPKGRKPLSYNEYMFAVNLGGLDSKKYPYCVQWRA